MTTYAGAVLPSGLPVRFGLWGCLQVPASTFDAALFGRVGQQPTQCRRDDQQPAGQRDRRRLYSGNLVRQFEQDWYHHVHLLPATIALGNLLSTQMRQVEVWNAHFAPKTLSAVIGAERWWHLAAAPANPPTTYGMLESRLHNVSVSLDGPPVIEADFTFQFPGRSADAVASPVGASWCSACKPNWADGWLERLMWATDVLTARDGTEQRVSLRDQAAPLPGVLDPGRAVTDAALLDVLLSAWQSRVYALPIWPDKSSAGGRHRGGQHGDSADHHQSRIRGRWPAGDRYQTAATPRRRKCCRWRAMP